MAKFVAYYRVSTNKQGQSGLGLDAQKAAVEDYVDRVDGELVAAFQEVESGAKAERKELQRALTYCRIKRAMLVVAKLDRLARNVHFISKLMESGVDFIAADMPDANRLTLHLISAIAEYERQVISERTKLAMRQAKLRGSKIGNPKAKELQPKAVQAAQNQADEFARTMVTILKIHDEHGDLSANKLADVLNAACVLGPRGGRWFAASVIKLRKRISVLNSQDRK